MQVPTSKDMSAEKGKKTAEIYADSKPKPGKILINILTKITVLVPGIKKPPA